jgi:hypothetical protein
VTVAGSIHYSTQNFAGAFSISGKVINSSGVGLSGVTVKRIHASGTIQTVTNATGGYSFTNVPASNSAYTIQPELSGSTFSPASTAVVVTTANHSTINFTRTSPAALLGSAPDSTPEAQVPNTTDSLSTAQLSSATASTVEEGIMVELIFTGPLEAASAGDINTFAVYAGDQQLPITGARVDATTSIITLLLPAKAARPDDELFVSWANLIDSEGKPLSAETHSILWKQATAR